MRSESPSKIAPKKFNLMRPSDFSEIRLFGNEGRGKKTAPLFLKKNKVIKKADMQELNRIHNELARFGSKKEVKIYRNQLVSPV